MPTEERVVSAVTDEALALRGGASENDEPSIDGNESVTSIDDAEGAELREQARALLEPEDETAAGSDGEEPEGKMESESDDAAEVTEATHTGKPTRKPRSGEEPKVSSGDSENEMVANQTAPAPKVLGKRVAAKAAALAPAPKRVPWSDKEVELLRRGVRVHGAGHWKVILESAGGEGFHPIRTPMHLKDKWRNLGDC